MTCETSFCKRNPARHVGSLMFFFPHIDVDHVFFAQTTYAVSDASFHLFYSDEGLELESL